MKKFNVMKTIVMTMLFSAATMYGCAIGTATTADSDCTGASTIVHE